MKVKSIREVKNLKGKKVLVRVDCNVPLKNGRIADDNRIRAILPTIKYLTSRGASVILMSHLGRPKGKVVPGLSNKIIADRLAKLLKKKIAFVPEVVGDKAKAAIKNLKFKEIVMLENVRFHPREKMNCKRLAKILTKEADIYVNDAFAVSHRKQSSVESVTNYLPSYAGLLLEKEIINLSKVLESKVKPKVAIIGGAKLETKVKVIKNLLAKMDYVLIGGAIANNFIKAMDYEVGKSLIDDNELKTAKSLICDKLITPIDVMVTSKISAVAASKVRPVGQIGKNDIILDLGPDTVKLYSEILKPVKLVVWNGPLGYFEISKFKKSSQAIAKKLASASSFKVIGGGETVQLIKNLKLNFKNLFLSTGGGAMLEFLEGKTLPGIKPLIK